jgi:predicted amidohydrolase YtcJ
LGPGHWSFFRRFGAYGLMMQTANLTQWQLHGEGFAVMNITALINGDVWTMDSSTPKCQGVLIKDNRIAFIGDNQTVLAESKKHAKPEVIDLKGKSMLPGFIDAHLQIVWQARTLLQIDCFRQRSIPEIIALLKKQRVEATDGQEPAAVLP